MDENDEANYAVNFIPRMNIIYQSHDAYGLHLKPMHQYVRPNLHQLE